MIPCRLGPRHLCPRLFWGLIVILLALEPLFYFELDRTLVLQARAFGQTHENLRAFFGTITDVGLGKWYAWTSGLAFLLSAGLLLRARLNETWRERMRTLALQSGFFFFATSGAGLACNAIKFFVGRSRPRLFFEDGTYGFDPLIYKFLWNSFPSGHTATVFSAAAAASFLYPKTRWILFPLAALIGLSRVMVGAHYPSDVIGGALVALVFTRFSVTLLLRTQKKKLV